MPSNQYVKVWSVALQLTSTLCQLPSLTLPFRGPRHGVDVGVPTDGELVADAAGCQGSAGVEEIGVIAGHVSDVGVLIGIEGDAEAVLDPHCAVVATNATDRLRPMWVILQHKRQTVGAVGIVTKIDVEGGLEVVGKIDALVEHRRARFAGASGVRHEGVVRTVVGGRAVDDGTIR